MASFKAGRPPAGLYRCHRGSRQASTAAETMYSGVGKSGSPAPKPITGRPAATRAFAFASTAKVADSLMDPIRLEIRWAGEVTAPSCQQAAPGSPPAQTPPYTSSRGTSA